MIDPVKNFAIGTISGAYDSDDTNIVLATGHASRFPDPSVDGAFNVVWYNSTDYSLPHEDPECEIVRVISKSGNTWTVIRAQEATVASIKNRSGKTYTILQTVTKKTVDDIRSYVEYVETDPIFTESPASDITTEDITNLSNFDLKADLVDGKVPQSQLPAIAITSVFVVSNQAEQLALIAEEGDVAIRTDNSKSYIKNSGVAGTMSDWNELLVPTGGVTSVNGESGAVTLTTSNISEGTNLYYTDERVQGVLASALSGYFTLDQTTTQTIINDTMTGESVKIMDGDYAINATGEVLMNGRVVVTDVSSNNSLILSPENSGFALPVFGMGCLVDGVPNYGSWQIDGLGSASFGVGQSHIAYLAESTVYNSAGRFEFGTGGNSSLVILASESISVENYGTKIVAVTGYKNGGDRAGYFATYTSDSPMWVSLIDGSNYAINTTGGIISFESTMWTADMFPSETAGIKVYGGTNNAGIFSDDGTRIVRLITYNAGYDKYFAMDVTGESMFSNVMGRALLINGGVEFGDTISNTNFISFYPVSFGASGAQANFENGYTGTNVKINDVNNGFALNVTGHMNLHNSNSPLSLTDYSTVDEPTVGMIAWDYEYNNLMVYSTGYMWYPLYANPL